MNDTPAPDTVIPAAPPPRELRPLEVCPGWTVDEILTEDDCDRAHVILSGHLASIEYQLGEHEIDPAKHAEDPRWVLRARAALRLKKAAYQSVEYKRRRFRTSYGHHSTVEELQIEIGRLQSILAGKLDPMTEAD